MTVLRLLEVLSTGSDKLLLAPCSLSRRTRSDSSPLHPSSPPGFALRIVMIGSWLNESSKHASAGLSNGSSSNLDAMVQ